MLDDVSTRFLFGVALAGFAFAGCAPGVDQSGDDEFPVLSGEYLGQPTPGMKAELFAPGVVSTGLSELNSNFFPGGKEVIFSVNVGPMKWALVMMREEDGRWTEPEVAPFSGQHGGVDPFVSYDGTLYFQSRRDGCIGASDIYRAEFAGGEYADAECLPEPINSPGFEGDAMIDPDERYLIVSTRREDALGPGGADLYVSFLAVTE